MNILLSVKCYNCNSITENNINAIKRTGNKTFRIYTACAQCKQPKSKAFTDSYNQLPKEMYQLIHNKIYLDSFNGNKFEDLDKTIYEYKPTHIRAASASLNGAENNFILNINN